MLQVWWFQGIHYKYGSFNADKIQRMGKRDMGLDCEFGDCHYDEFISKPLENIMLSVDWQG